MSIITKPIVTTPHVWPHSEPIDNVTMVNGVGFSADYLRGRIDEGNCIYTTEDSAYLVKYDGMAFYQYPLFKAGSRAIPTATSSGFFAPEPIATFFALMLCAHLSGRVPNEHAEDFSIALIRMSECGYGSVVERAMKTALKMEEGE